MLLHEVEETKSVIPGSFCTLLTELFRINILMG